MSQQLTSEKTHHHSVPFSCSCAPSSIEEEKVDSSHAQAPAAVTWIPERWTKIFQHSKFPAPGPSLRDSRKGDTEKPGSQLAPPSSSSSSTSLAIRRVRTGRKRAETLRLVIVGDKNVGKMSLLLRLLTDRAPPMKRMPTIICDSILHVEVDVDRIHMGMAMDIDTVKEKIEEGNESTPPPTTEGNMPIFCIFAHTVDAFAEALLGSMLRRETASGIKWEDSRAHIIVLCFAVDDQTSFVRAVGKWADDLASWCPGKPIILAGLKADLRDCIATPSEPKRVGEKCGREERKLVRMEDGLAAARRMGALAYVECSPWTGHGVWELVDAVVRIGLLKHREHTRQQGEPRHCVIL